MWSIFQFVMLILLLINNAESKISTSIKSASTITFGKFEWYKNGSILNIDIDFPDGHKDRLILEKQPQISLRNENFETESCRYMGYLANDEKACVAMTGCYGKENIEFTINSEHSGSTNMYILNTNGQIEDVENDINMDSLDFANHYNHTEIKPQNAKFQQNYVMPDKNLLKIQV